MATTIENMRRWTWSFYTIFAGALVLTAMAVALVYMVGEMRQQLDCSFGTVEVK